MFGNAQATMALAQMYSKHHVPLDLSDVIPAYLLFLLCSFLLAFIVHAGELDVTSK